MFEHMFDDVRTFSEMSRNVRTFSEMFGNVRKCSRMFENVPKKLWPVQALLIDGRPCRDMELRAKEVQQLFGKNWTSDDMVDNEMWRDFRDGHARKSLRVTAKLVQQATKLLKSCRLVDVHDVSGFLLQAIAMSDEGSSLLADILNCSLTSDARMSETAVVGRVMGKIAGTVPVGKLRALLPQTAMHQLAHAVMSVMLEPYIGAKRPDHPAVQIAGGTKGIQTLDISMALQLVIEKCMDDKSRAAIGQSDMHQYFDYVIPGKLAYTLSERGTPPAFAAAAIRLHLAPKIRLRVGT